MDQRGESTKENEDDGHLKSIVDDSMPSIELTDRDSPNKDPDLNKKSRLLEEIHFNALLPYANDLNSEADALFAKIKANFGRSVMLRKIKPDCMIWANMLNKYIILYGLRFTKEDHTTFVKLFYELITIPNLESTIVAEFCSHLLMLLRKVYLISPEELELPWRPLYNLYNHVLSPSQVSFDHHPVSLENLLESLIYVVKIYFPANATKEILDEIKPQICLFQTNITLTAMRKFQLFLPVQFLPETHSLGYELWFSEFMDLWGTGNIPWGSSMMHLMSQLAYYNIGYIDWEPYIPLMFTRFVRSLNLPVSYKHASYNANHELGTYSISLWITSVLGGKSSTKKYLDNFLKTIETYFHPANYGSWLAKLTSLYTNLSYLVLFRLYRERYQVSKPITPIPESHKLTDLEIDEFVESMLPIAMIGLFNENCSTAFYNALLDLSIMRPNFVIPKILEKVYPTLGSDIEPHKFITVMTCMVNIARPMIQGSRIANKEYAFQEGPLQVLPLLFASLSGIDPNDPDKVYITFKLIATYATMIPIVDCSKSTAELSEDDRLICEETSRFEDFVLQFMDKVFIWIDTSSVVPVRLENNTNSNNKSESEEMSETDLYNVFSTLLRQTSSSIFCSALNKLKSFIVEHVLETQVAGQLVASLCTVFSNVNAAETLKALLPFLSEKVLDAIGEGDEVIKTEHLDNHLMYPLLLLNRLVNTQGDVLLPYLDTLIKVIDKVIRFKSREGNRLGCFTLANVLQSLSSSSFINADRDLDNPDSPYIKDWGETVKIKSMKMKVFMPGDKELAALQTMFTRYFLPAIETLDDFINSRITLSRDDLKITLRIIFNTLDGCESALPLWKESPLKIEPFEDCLEPFEPTVGPTLELKMPDGTNVRYFLVQKMALLQEVILKNIEDDTEVLNIVQLIWQNLLLGKYRMAVDPGYTFPINYCITKAGVENKMTGNAGWFPLLILTRVDYQHQMRLNCATSLFTNTHYLILLNLLTLSTSHYSDIRTEAQDTILTALGYFPSAYKFLMPHILEILRKHPNIDHHALKGVLYLITDSIKQEESLLVKQDWEMIKELWPALVLSESSEKPSIIELKDDILEFACENFYTTSIKLEIPDSCLSIAADLWNKGMEPNGPKPTDDEIQKGIENLRENGERNSRTYHDILNKLLSALMEKNLHWRDRLTAMTFFEVLVHSEEMFPPQIVRFLLNTSIHDSVEEREIALKILMYVFKKLKKKHKKVQIDLSRYTDSSPEEKSNKIQPGCRADNAWLQYNYVTRPTNSAAWDEPRYVHKSHIGYYTWPKELLVYAPSSEQPNFDRDSLTDQDREIYEFFSDQDNVDKLIEYLSLEGDAGIDAFSVNRSLMFKGLFRNYGDAFLSNFLPHLQRLVAEKKESSQCCAAEIICGLIEGAKHWPYEMTEAMWSVMLPVVRTALDNLTAESISSWTLCMSLACKDRDPNRMHWLLEHLMEESSRSQSDASLVECGKLTILQGALLQQSWKVGELLYRLLMRFESMLEDSLQNVRNRLASTLVSVFEVNFGTTVNGQAFPKVDDFLDKIYPRFLSLLEENESPKIAENENKIKTDCPDQEPSQQTSNSKAVDSRWGKNSRLLVTICRWIQGTILYSSHESLLSFYKILPIICQLENNENEEDLSTTCIRTVADLAQTAALPQHIPTILEVIIKISGISSWSARASCLDFLQVFVFNNMSILLSNDDWVQSIQSIVLKLLEDDRLEVREKAAQVLSGLLHCSIVPEREALLDNFKQKSKTKISKKRKKMSDASNEQTEIAIINAVRSRHAGVLGMCTFIQAHPYDVPKYVPPIFEYLSSHLHDPEPIASTIRKTLNDFKRTHCDGWTGLQGLAEYFTEEQLAVVQDLTVPPSYYA